ncbi:hypothetical protein DFS34DRAFT_103966 [Phlyctochytrium arcticum]|nr:hypothetical protein DFS34DRAFT_103966 [Phlyctochytrium arcticum]
MPICVTNNTYIGLKAANSSIFESVDVVPDPKSRTFAISDRLQVFVGPPLGILAYCYAHLIHSDWKSRICRWAHSSSAPSQRPFDTNSRAQPPKQIRAKGLDCRSFQVSCWRTTNLKGRRYPTALSDHMEEAPLTILQNQNSPLFTCNCPRFTSFDNVRLLCPLNITDFLRTQPPHAT